MGLYHAVLVNKHSAINEGAHPIKPAEFAGNTGAHYEGGGEYVKDPGQSQRLRLSKQNGNGMQLLVAIELLVLKRINDVKTAYPGDYGQGKQDGKQGKRAGNHQIGANRGQRKSQPQNQMAQSGKPFGIAVTQHNQQGHRGQVKTKRVDEPGRCQKQYAVEQGEIQGGTGADRSAGYFPAAGARIASIYIPVQIPVERHGGAAGKDHAGQHQQEFVPVKACARVMDSQEKSDHRKRHGEYRMAEFDQGKVFLHCAPFSIAPLTSPVNTSSSAFPGGVTDEVTNASGTDSEVLSISRANSRICWMVFCFDGLAAFVNTRTKGTRRLPSQLITSRSIAWGSSRESMRTITHCRLGRLSM